jgi:alpha-mannosidase
MVQPRIAGRVRGARRSDQVEETFMQRDRAEPRAGRLLHMIGNAHIDPVWLWRWPEGYQEVRATFRSVIERMREYPELRFTCDSVAQLAWVEESDPELFEEIRRRVAEGRWEIAGGWWVEPDCNLPCGESFVRQALYGQRWLQERFGRIATVGCNVDPFGHNATLPQILRSSGMDTYLFLRPGPRELRLEGPAFWWRSPDGSRVLAYRIPHEYQTTETDLDQHVRAAVEQLPPDWKELACLYGVGNHGGGPTRANHDSIRRMSEAGEPAPLECSTARRFFDRLLERGEELPVVAGELQHHAVGCYSAHAAVKRWNRRAESLLLAAEKWSAVAAVVAGTPPAGVELGHAWRLVLFNQFHDVLAGTAIEPAYEDARDQLGEAASIAGRAGNRAMQALSRRIAIEPEPGMSPAVVFNPHPWPVLAEVEVEVGGARPGRVADERGRTVPAQAVQPSATVPGWRHRLVFPAELPPLGYRTYRLYTDLPGGGDARPATAGTTGGTSRADGNGLRPGSAGTTGGGMGARALAEPGGVVLESGRLRVRLDAASGWLGSLVEVGSGVELLPESPGPHAVVLADPTDTWSHGTLAYRDEIGAFACESLRVLEEGPVRAVARAVSRYGASTLTEDLVLGSGGSLEVRATLDWHERLALLKLRVGTALREVTASFDIPYGHLERPPDGGEEPAGAWVDLSGSLPGGRRAGLAILNDGKHAFDVLGGRVGMTVARSPVYAWHEPRQLDPGEDYRYLDQGVQRFTYRLLPHHGDWRAGAVARGAAELNQPPVALVESCHLGPLEQRRAFVAVEPASVLLVVLKQAEDPGGDLVVRAYESAGRPAPRVTIDLPLLGRRIETAFGAYQIKTFRVPIDPAAPAVETDLLERPLPGA